jgi:multidrug transporter EmrE-like cation transporter
MSTSAPALDASLRPGPSSAAAVSGQSTSFQPMAVQSIALVIVCTVIGAAAQILMRWGADYLTLETSLAGVLTNWPLLAGYACLGLNTLLLIVALRDGQLSVLYPIIALTYVWVTILSPMFFPDTINAFKIIGVGFIVAGVSVIGAGSRR